MAWLPVLHTPDEDVAFFRDRVLAETEVWIADLGFGPVGFSAVRPGWIDHLYVDPACWGEGIGRKLLARGKPAGGCVHLWTFERNLRTRRFYEFRGFVMIERTDGSRNEEKEPDMLYRWGAPE